MPKPESIVLQAVPEAACIRIRAADHPHLRECWRFAAESFCERMENISISIDFSSDSPAPDIQECSPPFFQYPYDAFDAVDLSSFRDSPLILAAPKLVGFIASANLLLYDPEQLERLHLPAPAWDTPETCSAYLGNAFSMIAKQELPPPPSIQQPLTHLGNYLHELCKDIRRSHFIPPDVFESKHLYALQYASEPWRQYPQTPQKRVAGSQEDFWEGRTPFLFADSFFPRCASFPFCPMPDACGNLSAAASLLQLSAHTKCPAEALRFLKHLQSSPVQQEFARAGCIPLRTEDRACFPGNLDFQNIPGEPFFFRSPEEHYIGMNIINVELRECISHGTTVEDALRNILNLSRLALKLKS